MNFFIMFILLNKYGNFSLHNYIYIVILLLNFAIYNNFIRTKMFFLYNFQYLILTFLGKIFHQKLKLTSIRRIYFDHYFFNYKVYIYIKGGGGGGRFYLILIDLIIFPRSFVLPLHFFQVIINKQNLDTR